MSDPDPADNLDSSHPTEVIGTPHHTPVTGPPLPTGAALGPGQRIAGRYELVRLLGRGGMGAVYEARDLELQESVALKLLRPELDGDPEIEERFRREVKLARRVTHRNIARTFDLGEAVQGRFITMEYIDGESLTDRLAGGPMPVDEVLRVARAVCDGLGAAHLEGIVHRDLKPDNVMIDRRGRVVVTDFGIARAVAGPAQAAQLTGANLIGTPTYMAPEQLEGGREIDHRADLYAFGVMLWQMVAGAPPWSGDSVFSLLRERLTNPTPPPPPRAGLPPALADVIGRCLALDPDARYASVTELSAALAQVAEAPATGTGVLPGPEPGATHRIAPSAAVQPTRVVTRRGVQSVAVLPFRNAGPPEDAYLADGLTEELIDTLSMTEGLRVRPRADIVRLANADVEPVQVGRQLGVTVLVEGSLRRLGEAIRISARLISVADGFQRWAQRFDTSPGALLATSDAVASAVAQELTQKRCCAERTAPADPEAIDLYLQARYKLQREWYTDVGEAAALFDQALERAPHDPRILAGAATAHARLVFHDSDSGRDRLHVERATLLAEQAIGAAPDRGEPYFALGMARFYAGEPVAAVRALRMALERSPELAEAHALLGRTLREVGPLDHSLAHIQEAQRLDHTLVDLRYDLVWIHALAGRWETAQELLDLPAPSEATDNLRNIIRARVALWRTSLGHAVTIDDGPLDLEAGMNRMTDLLRTVLGGGTLTPELRQAFEDNLALVGQRTRVSTLMQQYYSEMLTHVGDTDGALEYLARAVHGGMFDRVWMDRCPTIAPLRALPRFVELRAEVEERLAHLS